MPVASVVRAWQDGRTAYLAVRVLEGAKNVEYVGSVPLADLAGLTVPQQRAALTAATKAVRDAQLAGSPVDIGGIVGTINV